MLPSSRDARTGQDRVVHHVDVDLVDDPVREGAHGLRGVIHGRRGVSHDTRDGASSPLSGVWTSSTMTLTSTTSRPVIRSMACFTLRWMAASDVGDADPVLDHDVEIDRRLRLADLDAHPLGDVGAGAAGDALAEGPERSGAAAAHGVDTGHLPAGHPGDLLYDVLARR